MLKIVTLFLIFMAVLAMFGRLRLPKITRRLWAAQAATVQDLPALQPSRRAPARIVPNGQG